MTRTVTLTFQASAEHVRTARLVAVAVARRAGLGEARLDEVRLAVGELCARAVRRCAAHGVAGTVRLDVDDAGPLFGVTVVDPVAAPDGHDEAIALAIVRDLADKVTVSDGPSGEGGAVTAGWLVHLDR